MQNSSLSETRRGLLFTLLLLGMVTALVLVPSQFRSEAGSKTGEGLFPKTVSLEEGIDKMWDIRDAGKAENVSMDVFAKFRESVGKDAASIADVRDGFVRGEAELKARLPHVKIEYNTDIRTPEAISPDVSRTTIEFLTPPSTAKRSEILRNFVKENDSLIGVNTAQADSLKVAADYTNPDGNMSYAHLEQVINGVSMFRGEVKAGFNRSGQIVRIINNLAPGLDYGSISKEFGDPVAAVRVAAAHVKAEILPENVTRNDALSKGNMVVFGTGDSAWTAEKMYFPTEPGVAVPAWRVGVYKKVAGYYVIVDAEHGIVLWHKNLVDDQTQSATYNVYVNPNAYINAADSPAAMSPYVSSPANDPTVGAQAAVGTRVNVTRIGNEAPFTFNNLGWMTDGTNVTDGNTVEAGLDVVAPDGVDAPETGSPNRVFDAPTWNPPPGNPAPGDAPSVAAARRGAVIQMFYVMNWHHDEMYRVGFTEPARNFQTDNFGRGGLGNDRNRAEGQDSSGTNNANFLTNADGTRSRMQMYVWTGPTPDYDGTADAEVILHEVTHGVSNRLIGNTGGLGNQGGMMGEGWSDWYGITMLSEPTDPINGIYTTGGYVTHLIAAGFMGNYYYGIRRFPKAVLSFTGGPPRAACGNAPCPHNPLSFRHLNAGCDTEIGTTTVANISAFPRGPVGTVGSCAQVHNGGEIWSSALWEVRALLIQRLGWAVGNRRALQLVTDGMKLTQVNPTMLHARDGIIAAAAALPGPEASADVVDVREGFRRRGMGFSATVTSSTVVTEAFDFPNIQVVNPFSVSDSTGDNDGFPEPGENVLLNVSITNATGAAITNVQANVNGGPNVSYGTINDGQTVAMNIPYLVPAGAVCGSLHQVTINASSSVGAQTPVTREFRLGAPVGGAPVTFTSTTAVTINDNSPATPYSTDIAVSGLTGNKIVKLSLNNVTHTFPGDLDFLLVGPAGQKFTAVSDSGGGGDVSGLTIAFTDTAATLPSTTQWVAGTFRPHNVDTTTDAFPAPAPASPYLNPAPAGTATFESAFGTAGASLNGTWTLWVRDDAGTDVGTMGGWSLTFEANDYACSITPTTVRSRADFDGDGRTDLSVFRNGQWFLNRSTAGFGVLGWGINTDTLVPGDYDGDLKADAAVFRANADPSQPDFYILNSNGFTVTGVAWGTTGDVPVTGDYDGDGKTDVAVFRPSTNTWFVLKSTGGFTSNVFGQAGDVPVVGNFDNDALADRTVYRSGSWISELSGGGTATISLGTAGDILVPADYDGDNIDDRAVFRPSAGTWIVRNSDGGSTVTTAWGTSGDIPVPGDYDGDGKDDLSIYRDGQWWLNRSTAGAIVQSFGLAGDTPIPRKYIP